MRIAALPATPKADRLCELEEIIRDGCTSFIAVGNALAEISEQKLYKISEGGKYKSFESYCKEVWGFGRQYAYRQISAAKVSAAIASEGPEKLSPIGDKTNTQPANEHQARKAIAERKASAKSTEPSEGAGVEAAGTSSEPEPLKDKAGNVVPESLRPVFESLAEFSKAERLHDEAARAVRELAKLQAGAFLHMESYEPDLKNAKRNVMAARPYALCACRGADKKCSACRGLGWLNKSVYERLSLDDRRSAS